MVVYYLIDYVDDCPSVIIFFPKKLDIESKGEVEMRPYPNSLMILQTNYKGKP